MFLIVAAWCMRHRDRTRVTLCRTSLPPSDFLTPPSPLAVLDGLPTGLAILDNHGRIWYMNDACRQLLGVFSSNPADIAGSDSYVALLSICNAERDTIVEALNSVAAGERTRVDLEQSIVVDGQRRWIELTIAAYAFDNAMGIIVEHRDISARKQAEALRMALYRIADLTSSAEDMTSFYAAIPPGGGRTDVRQEFLYRAARSRVWNAPLPLSCR
ncbi:MAG: hypothetical protein KatS3mg057_1640 [Herpetosiphonaceae bacterium]|nr:MAG: hypothetical protein KatS3mg057_1640 [Herpetosiphonaceae bacterium]